MSCNVITKSGFLEWLRVRHVREKEVKGLLLRCRCIASLGKARTLLERYRLQREPSMLGGDWERPDLEFRGRNFIREVVGLV